MIWLVEYLFVSKNSYGNYTIDPLQLPLSFDPNIIKYKKAYSGYLPGNPE